MKYLWLIALACGLAFGADDVKTLRATIKAHNKAHVAGLVNGDAQACAAIYTKDTVIMFPGVPLMKGRESVYRERQKAFSRARILSGKQEIISLEMSGDLAYEIGEFTYEILANGKIETRIVSGKYIVIWEKQPDGDWLRKVDAGLPDPS